jgi:putative heme transporter
MVVGPVLRRRWRSGALAVLLLAGFIVVIASTDGSLLSRTASVLRRLDWAWIPAALVVEWTSMASSARAHRRLLRGGGLELQIMSMVAVTYAGNAISVSLPVAGPGGRRRLCFQAVPPSRC